MSKVLLAGAAVLILSAGSVSAQTPAATTTPPATSATTTATPAKGLSLDTPIEQIAADPKGKAVLDADLPGLTTHPSYDEFKSMSLKEVQPLSQGVLTDAMLAKAGADLSALGK